MNSPSVSNVDISRVSELPHLDQCLEPLLQITSERARELRIRQETMLSREHGLARSIFVKR